MRLGVGKYFCKRSIIERVHSYHGNCLFGSKGQITVRLNDCQNLLKEQTHFDAIIVNGTGICGKSKREISDGTYCEVNGVLKQKLNFQSSNGVSTIGLLLPGVTVGIVNLEHYKNLNPHMVVNFDLAKCEDIVLPNYTPIKHLEFVRPMDGCCVKFDADVDGILLEINDFPQNSNTNTGEPFKMSFRSLDDSELLTIKLNNVDTGNIKWYKRRNELRIILITPVISENQMKANAQGWKALKMPHICRCYETLELNSDFLFAQSAG
jgi:hypothetical protein